MKRKTTHRRRHSEHRVLQVRVMSPRIAWFGFLKLMVKLTKLACVLAVFVGVGWGIWRGIQHAFYKNPDFRLQVLDLNTNPVIDELGVAKAAGIDLTADPSLFDVDVEETARKIKDLPEIIDAQVERHLPGTLVVRVVPRTPKSWISCDAGGHSKVRQAGALLVDADGIAYPCSELQVEAAKDLPVILLSATPEHPILVGKKISHPELEHCLMLLDAAQQADSDALHWIESIRPINAWSLELVTRHGTAATFGLGDHERQIESLRAALDHAGTQGYFIETINLIPKYNIPITVRDGNAPPKAIPLITSDAAPEDVEKSRSARDLGNLLNRN